MPHHTHEFNQQDLHQISKLYILQFWMLSGRRIIEAYPFHIRPSLHSTRPKWKSHFYTWLLFICSLLDNQVHIWLICQKLSGDWNLRTLWWVAVCSCSCANLMKIPVWNFIVWFYKTNPDLKAGLDLDTISILNIYINHIITIISWPA